MQQDNYVKVVRGSDREVAARKRLLELFKQSPIPDDEILVNLGLYLRGTAVAKILYLNELYQHILHLPGIIVELGTWWGANLALFESLRSVHEPYNWTRTVVGFDTFEGYPTIDPKDGHSAYAQVGGYKVNEGYESYLDQLLGAHEEDNVMAHIKKHQLVKGNVVLTIDQYLDANPQAMVALAYFDLALYEPTRKCLEALGPHLMRGSILAMDELNSPDFPGETVALKEVLGLSKYRTLRSKFLPDRSYLIVE